jgi:type IV pilus assembly protein PilX
MIKSRHFKYSRPAQLQRGAVLVVALIFLLLFTILAISASGRSILQEGMAGALRNAGQADLSAETALRGAEWRLWTSTSQVGGHLDCLNGSISSDDGCVIYNPGNPPYDATGAVTQFRTKAGWLTGTGKTYKGPSGSLDYTATTSNSALYANPQYIIEDMGPEQPPGTGPQHEAGDTGPLNIGPGQLNTHVFRITARATGANQNTVRIVQSTFDAQATN